MVEDQYQLCGFHNNNDQTHTPQTAQVWADFKQRIIIDRATVSAIVTASAGIVQ